MKIRMGSFSREFSIIRVYNMFKTEFVQTALLRHHRVIFGGAQPLFPDKSLWQGGKSLFFTSKKYVIIYTSSAPH